jgi:hypothetical protein
MKSIMQEASSIIKALEKAWTSAGQPREFSVKVYEEPEKNFLGMTTKSAKIGIFFQEKPAVAEKKEQKPKIRAEAPPAKVVEQKKQPSQKQPVVKPLLARKPEETKIQQAQRQQRVIWTDDMVSSASTWIRGALKAMDKSNISFTSSANNYYLRFTFNAPIGESSEKERHIFRSLSFLLLQSLKRQLKRPLRGFKVVLTREV